MRADVGRRGDALTVAGTCGGAFAATGTSHAGPSGDTTAVTPIGFRVTPAGRQTTLGDLPVTSAVSPDGKKLLVIDAGDGNEAVQVIDVATARMIRTSTYKAPQGGFDGVAFSPNGRHAYASEGGDDLAPGRTVMPGEPAIVPDTSITEAPSSSADFSSAESLTIRV